MEHAARDQGWTACDSATSTVGTASVAKYLRVCDRPLVTPDATPSIQSAREVCTYDAIRDDRPGAGHGSNPATPKARARDTTCDGQPLNPDLARLRAPDDPRA